MHNSWVDTHCHFLFDYTSQDEIKEMLEELKELAFAIFISTEEKDFPIIQDLCSQIDNLYGTIGIHPDCIEDLTIDCLARIKEEIKNNPKILGIGEIGLDYYRDKTQEQIQLQKIGFEQQLQVALDLEQPIVVHARDSIFDCLEILKNFRLVKPLVFHCFTASVKEAEAILNQGYWISYTGAVTYPKNGAIRQAVEITPKDRLMVETDSPFLAPVPHRGKHNHPIWVSYIGEEIAKIKGWSTQECKNITTSNAYRFFNFPTTPN